MSGTTGESPTLSTEEKLRLFGEIKEEIGERGSVIAGTGNYSTTETIELSQEAEKIGVDGVLLVVLIIISLLRKGYTNILSL
ncbi:MAG: hypothetical protein Ct9H300mP27_08650 [Chloroflexota bacterium]|nr:MAG: hypothetical protein Ct9H300mP27_08650 [Chloroflexota bacterium]